MDARKGKVTKVGRGGRPGSRGKARANRAPRMGMSKVSQTVFNSPVCLQSHSEQQTSVTKNLKGQETHKT